MITASVKTQKRLNQSINQFIYFRPHGSMVNRGQTTGR